MKWGAAAAILVLLIMFLILKKTDRSRAWFKKGGLDIASKKTILGFLLFELAAFIGTFAPYIREGTCKEISDYSSFAFPCLAGIIAGGGLFFDNRREMGASDWLYIISVILLAIGYVTFIWPTVFFFHTIFLDLILIGVAGTCGLFYIALKKNYTRRPLDGLFVPTFVSFGFVSSVGGIVFYFCTSGARHCG